MTIWFGTMISNIAGYNGSIYIKVKLWLLNSKDNLFFGSLLLILNESIIQLIMSALIFLNDGADAEGMDGVDVFTQYNSVLVGYGCVGVSFVVFPCLYGVLIVVQRYHKVDLWLRKMTGSDLLTNIRKES